MLAEISRPWVLMAISAACFFLTLFKLIAAFDLPTLTSWPKFKETWFGVLWTYVAPITKKSGLPKVLPLVEGRVRNGEVHDKVVSQPLHGTVLEVGAGSGLWTDAYKKVADDAKRTGRPGPTKIYGVEPNHMSAATLRQHVKEIGLDHVYEVVPVGIEDLDNPGAWGATIEPESVDCIVTVQCLCSIPEPEKNVALLYNYLKKGGRWYVYEHVRNDRGGLWYFFQSFTDFFWKYMMGSCRLCLNTEKTLTHTAMWDKIDLAQPPEEPSYQIVPHIYGTLVK
ncbi:unnamed protein product [Clonostachys solani]|uniref:Methyltransferase-like protein 7B n=1 Tax=Clonostachys solani TaxID=160281 RepID=A0A9N9Z744_9HYPO|nr:unnamed protein product [Clonostachys solani]